jgi:hypothetical protein
VNPRLVRGLDYYTRTTFEFTVPSGDASGLGTQNALLGGGRYDGLSEMLGGPRAPGIGFAIGQDRLILTLQAQAATQPLEPRTLNLEPQKLDAYIAPLGPERNSAALTLARELRRAGLTVEVGDGTFRLKKSFEAADRIARNIVLLGEDELATNAAPVKTFATGEQARTPLPDLEGYLGKSFVLGWTVADSSRGESHDWVLQPLTPAAYSFAEQSLADSSHGWMHGIQAGTSRREIFIFKDRSADSDTVLASLQRSGFLVKKIRLAGDKPTST